MNNVEAIKKSLQSGTDPAMICMTCPWDRFCLTPPTMTAGDIEEQIEKVSKPKREGEDNFFGAIMGTLLFAGKDTQATLCPILVNRLHSSGGKKVADALRKIMQEWAD